MDFGIHTLWISRRIFDNLRDSECLPSAASVDHPDGGDPRPSRMRYGARRSGMRLFAYLGALVESRWRDNNYNEDLFPGIAAQALSEIGLISRVDPWEIIRWFHTTPELPQQIDLEANFGDPPLTL